MLWSKGRVELGSNVRGKGIEIMRIVEECELQMQSVVKRKIRVEKLGKEDISEKKDLLGD